MKICTLSDIRVVTGAAGVLYISKVDGAGARGEDLNQIEHKGKDFSLYRCNNCGREKKEFNEARQHLGKFNDMIDPFNYPDKREPPG